MVATLDPLEVRIQAFNPPHLEHSMLSPHLTVRDYDALFRALDALYGQVVNVDAFPHHAHGILSQFIPCDNWAYVERHVGSGRAYAVLRHAPPDLVERFTLYYQIRTDYEYFDDVSAAHGGQVRSIDDFMSWRQYRETRIYRDVLQAVAFKHILAISPLEGGSGPSFSMARDGRCRFSERDKAFLAVLQPHLLRVRDIARLRTVNEGRPPSVEDLRQLRLTEREAEILHWVAQGKSNSEIAIIFGTREQTIKNHVYSIFTKIGVENRAAAIVHALRTPRQYIPCEIGIVADDEGAVR